MIKPYYHDDYCTIYHGDCRKVLQSLDGVTVVLTDPPYGISGGSGGQAKKTKKGVYDASFCDSPQYIQECVVPVIQFCRVIARSVVVTPGCKNMHLYPAPKDVGCFWHPAASNRGPWGFSTFTPIFYYGKSWKAGKGDIANGVQVTERAEKLGHPCNKPLKAWTWLLNKISPPEAVILDPFMGSGTTLRAAKDLKRKAIGIELEEKYCEIAAKRLRQEPLL